MLNFESITAMDDKTLRTACAEDLKDFSEIQIKAIQDLVSNIEEVDNLDKFFALFDGLMVQHFNILNEMNRRLAENEKQRIKSEN